MASISSSGSFDFDPHRPIFSDFTLDRLRCRPKKDEPNFFDFLFEQKSFPAHRFTFTETRRCNYCNKARDGTTWEDGDDDNVNNDYDDDEDDDGDDDDVESARAPALKPAVGEQ